MAEHICEKHQTAFTRKTKGNKSWYAHPIIENGETVGWCNEDAKEVAKLEPRKTEPVPLQEGEEPLPKTKSQEIAEHVWWKELGEMLRAKDIDLTKPAGKGMRTAYYAQMLSVLPIKIEDK